MPRVDIETFPKLIIQIPEEEFPDKLKIVMTGRKVPTGGLGKTAQLASDAKSLSSGAPQEPVYFTTTWTESNFTKVITGKKTAELKAPYNEVISVVGYAHREDFKNEIPVNVAMFTSRQNMQPSSTGSDTSLLEKVWAYRFTMTKQKIDSSYIVGFVQDTVPISQVSSIVTQFTSFFGEIVSMIMKPSLPTPKAIASKLLGPAAAPVQNMLATAAEQYAKVKPTVDKITQAAQAIVGMVQNPKTIVQYLPVMIAFLEQYIPQEKISKIIYEFKGGA